MSLQNMYCWYHVKILFQFIYLINEGWRYCSSLRPAQQRNRGSGNMLAKINTLENGWSNFSANLKVVALKLLELLNSHYHIIKLLKFLTCRSSRWRHQEDSFSNELIRWSDTPSFLSYLCSVKQDRLCKKLFGSTIIFINCFSHIICF